MDKTVEEKFNKDCYVISGDEDLDGKFLKLDDAINLCDDYMGPSIIILSENIVLIKAEQVRGAAENYLLVK